VDDRQHIGPARIDIGGPENPPGGVQDHLTALTEQELKAHSGEGGSRLWIAIEGLVYDVTDCPKWRAGMHEEMHFPGQDLSGEIPDAPHTREVLERPCVKMVGRLVPTS
jgi:predicted heme/steroid binding protein